MAESPETRCMFVETDLDTYLAVLVHINETISDFKKKLCKEHEECFPNVGEINISAVKVKRRNRFYRLADRMILSKAFEGIIQSWFVYVDATLNVDKGELLSITDADQNCSNLELVEKKKEVAKDSLLLDGYAKNLTLEEDFETEIDEKTSRKRKLVSSDEETSRKKPSVDVNQSAAATTALRDDIDGSHELRGEVQVDVVASESCAVLPKEKLDDILTGAIGKENEMGEKSVEDVGRDKSESDHLASHPENQLDASSGLTTRPDAEKEKDADQNCSNHELFEKEKEIANDSVLLSGGTKNPTLEDGFETEEVSEKTTKKRKLKSLDGNKSQKKTSTDLNQSAAATAASRFDVYESHELGGKLQVGVVASEFSVGEKLDDTLTGAIGKENEMGEKSVEDVGRDQIETDNIASDPANHLVVSDLEEEKKKRRKKSSKDDIDQTSALVITTSRDIVNETNGVPEIVDRVDAEAMQKANEMVEKSVEDVRRDNIENDSLASHPENNLDANSGLTSRTNTEKKKRRKKSSKDDINQSSAVATTTSRDILNEINRVPGIVDRVDAEARQKANAMVDKSVEDVRRDDTETDSLASHPANHLDAYSGLTTRTDTEKKKRRKKSLKDDINHSSSVATTTSRDIVNEINGVSGNVDRVDSTSESIPISKSGKLGNTSAEAIQKENEMGEKIDDDVGSGKAIPSAADNIQTNNSEIDVDETKSVKSTKKKKSKKAKTLSKEDATVATAENVEPIKAVDGEEPDNVIRNVIDSLQERNDAEENLDKIEKKSSKKSKKKHSSKLVEPQDNAALEKTPPISNPNDTDAFITPAKKKDTESDALHLKKSTAVADNTEDNSVSKHIRKEKADMGDNFGSSQNDDTVAGGKKQEQVTGGAKSKKEKKRLDLHPGGSVDGSLSSIKPEEKKGRVHPASSGTSHLHSTVKNDGSGSVKVDVNSKKEAVKKSSESLTVKTNFFKDAELSDSSEDEFITSDVSTKTPFETSDVSTKTPSDISSDDDSDVTSMSRKQGGNNVGGGTNRFSGSLQDIVRRTRRYKEVLQRNSQAQQDESDDEGLAVDCVPDSQAV